jgi:hypothetical protein
MKEKTSAEGVLLHDFNGVQEYFTFRGEDESGRAGRSNPDHPDGPRFEDPAIETLEDMLLRFQGKRVKITVEEV